MHTASTPIEKLSQRVIADPEACQECGAEYGAPICSDCFDERWSRDNSNSGASAPNRR
jgi:hypothetical protein